MTHQLPRDLHGRFIGKIDAPGMYDVPADVYHDEPCATPSIGAGGLHTLLTECPAVYWHGSALNRNRVAFDTAAHRFGRAAHVLLLERERFFDLYEVLRPEQMRGDRGAALKGAAMRRGKTVLRLKDYEQIAAMVDAVMDHEFAGFAFQAGQPERTLVWRDAETGVWLRCRPDWLPEDSTHIPDYKTAASARPDRFARSIYEFGYHMRAAHYLDGIQAVTGRRPDSYYFVVQEKTPPYVVTVVTLKADALEWGAIQNRKALHLFADCLARNDWPGYARDVVEVDLPVFARAELQRLDDAGRFTITDKGNDHDN